MKMDDLERINGRFRITISSEMAIFSLFTQKYVANDKWYTATDTINHP